MNSTQSGTRTKKRLWRRGPVLLAAIPLILFGVLLIGLGVHEKLAANRVRAEVTRIRAAGDPIDDASTNRWFIANTHREGTPDWNEVLRLVEAGPAGFGNIDRIPYVGAATVPREIPSPGEWAEEKEVAEYLRWMRPVIHRIHQASEHPTPVWQPIEFDGFNTLLGELQGSRSIARLLQLEAEHAIYQGDAERALRALDSMQRVAAAFDWPFCMVSELVEVALRGVHQSMIRRSLTADIWNENQLRRLAAQLGPPRETPGRWQDIIAGERAMMMASIEEHPFYWDTRDAGEVAVLVRRWMLSLPSVREHLLGAYRDMEWVAAGGPDEITDRAEKLTERWSTQTEGSGALVLSADRITHMFLPAISAFAEAMEREESSRRFALTALAIKRYQIQEGQWPERLAELERVGLAPRDWKTVSGGPFGYEVGEDQVYLWSHLSTKEARVSATRPTSEEEKEWRDLTIIR